MLQFTRFVLFYFWWWFFLRLEKREKKSGMGVTRLLAKPSSEVTGKWENTYTWDLHGECIEVNCKVENWVRTLRCSVTFLPLEFSFGTARCLLV